MIATSLIARAMLSIPINGILVRLQEIPESIRRFCTPAFFYNDGQRVFDISPVGSALLFRYRGCNLAICTRHQIGHALSAHSDEKFFVIFEELGGSKVGLSPIAVSRVHMEHAEHMNLEDILVFEYEDERDDRNLRGLFLELDITRTLDTVEPTSIKAIFAIGYPTAFSDMNLECDEDQNITAVNTDLRWVKLYLTQDNPALLDTENRRVMIQDPRAEQETIEPDGMSGAPVFFVWLDESSRAHLGFAGMITDARDRRYMIYDGSIIRQIVDRHIDDPESRI